MRTEQEVRDEWLKTGGFLLSGDFKRANVDDQLMIKSVFSALSWVLGEIE